MPVTSSRKTYDCELCGASLQSKGALDNHLCLLHDLCGERRPGAEITFRCGACGTAFDRRSDLLAHMEQSGHGGSTRDPDQAPAGRRGAQRAVRGKARGRG